MRGLGRGRGCGVSASEQRSTAHSRCMWVVMCGRDGRGLDDGWCMEGVFFLGRGSNGDQKEGVNAFLDKRKPEWKNR